MTLPRFRLRTLMIAVVFVGGLLVGFVASCRRLETWGTAVHMRSVMQSLAQWGQEYAAVRNWREVERAIGMLEYAGRDLSGDATCHLGP